MVKYVSFHNPVCKATAEMPTMPATARMPATVRMQATTVKQATTVTPATSNIKVDRNIMTAHNSRNASNSRNDSNNRTANIVSKAGMLAKTVKPTTAWREANSSRDNRNIIASTAEGRPATVTITEIVETSQQQY
jgi:hypothetical protein